MKKTRYTYDTQGRLIRVQHPDGTETVYAYDKAGRRIRIETR